MDDETPTEYRVPKMLGTRPGAPWVWGSRIVHLVAGIPATGLWCDTCLLPSRYEVPVYGLGIDGIGRIGTLNHCDGCRP